jgi:uncharacterized protein
MDNRLSALTASHEVRSAPAKPVHRRSTRAIILTWLRKTHLYIGLWGAALGLLFGATGILMNHRAIMKIPVDKAAQSNMQLPVPERGFDSPVQLSSWLQTELQMKAAHAPMVKTHPAQRVIWGDREVMQPERWTVGLQRPDKAVNAEYIVGNRFVKVDRIDATPIGTLMRMHTSTGVSAFWVLLSDTIAGAMILLSLTGVLLWTQLHTIRTAAVMTGVSAMAAMLWYLWSV